MPATQSLSRALAAAVQDLVELGAEETVPTLERGHLSRSADGELRIRSERVPNWRGALASFGWKLFRCDSYDRAIDRLERAMPGRRRSKLGGPGGIFHVFAILYLERVAAFAWEEAAFDRTFADLERFLERREYAEVHWVSLANCRMARGLKEVQLGSLARIRGAETRDLEELWNRWQPYEVGTVDLDFACVLEVTQRFGAGEDLPDPKVALRLAEDVDLALKLVDESSVGKLLGWSRPDPDAGPFLEAIVGHSLHRGHRRVLPREPLVIGKAVARRLPELAERCRTARSDARFNFACRRFLFAFDRVELEDRMIDYWVAFEALFLPDASSELSYRAAMRIARFVGRTGAERQRLRRTLIDSYKLRSLIAHGVDLKTSKAAQKLEPFELAGETQQILRRSLLRWTDPDAPRSPADLDDALLA